MGKPLHLADPLRLFWAWRVAAFWAADLLRRQRQEAEILIAAELDAMGVTDRARAVDAAIRRPAFAREFLARFDAVKDGAAAPKNETEVRDLAFEVLAGQGVETADVHVLVYLHKDGRIRFGPEFSKADMLLASPSPEARHRAIDAINARAGREGA